MEVPQNIKNRTITWSSNPTAGCTSKEVECKISKRYFHTHVPDTSVHNNQEEWLNKIWFTGILLSVHKKEGNSITSYNMDESWGHYAKWNKPVTKRQILYESQMAITLRILYESQMTITLQVVMMFHKLIIFSSITFHLILKILFLLYFKNLFTFLALFRNVWARFILEWIFQFCGKLATLFYIYIFLFRG